MTRTISFLALAAMLVFGTVALTSAGGPDSGMKVETKPAPWQTVDGKLMKIDGRTHG